MTMLDDIRTTMEPRGAVMHPSQCIIFLYIEGLEQAMIAGASHNRVRNSDLRSTMPKIVLLNEGCNGQHDARRKAQLTFPCPSTHCPSPRLSDLTSSELEKHTLAAKFLLTASTLPILHFLEIHGAVAPTLKTSKRKWAAPYLRMIPQRTLELLYIVEF